MGRQVAIWAGLCWLGAGSMAFGQAYSTPVRASWTEDSATTATITWDREMAGRGTVRYGLAVGDDTREVHDGGGIHHHRLTLRHLEPGSRYVYEASSTDGFVQSGTFRTAPPAGQPLHFVAHGDLEGGLSVAGAQGVSDQIVQEDPQWILHLGDLSDEDYDGSGFGKWTNFFQIASNELAQAVFMPLMGNHDVPGAQAGDPDHWRGLFHRLFALPEPAQGNGYYGFSAGNVRFIALNSEVDPATQNDWLARELQWAASDTNLTWIIAYCHQPPYSWGERESTLSVRTHWAPLLTQYEANWLISGHSHNWQRTVPIRGVNYLVAGGGGGRLYTSAINHASHLFATTCYHHASFHVTNDVMQVRGIRSDGLVFDTAVVTNRRHVRVEPAFPLRGQTATVHYRAEHGPLAGANPVYIHLGQDEFSSAFADAPMTWNASGQHWEYDLIVPASATQRLAFVFRDHGGSVTNWHNNYEYDWQALLDRASVGPDPPAAGSTATLRYEADMGPLFAASEISAWMSFNGGRFVETGAVALVNVSGARWEAEIAVPAHAEDLTVHITGGGLWDDNARRLWTFSVHGADERAWPPAAYAAVGSPVVSEKPEGGAMNHIGDNFDLTMGGPALRVLDGPRGFGDFGSIWVNVDATNLYVGGHGMDLGGSNNVFVLFLGLDTLNGNAWNLVHKDGLPNTLDFLHNLRFTEPMDIAMVYGDQYGDRATYTNFTYGGYDFGQGIYYLGTNSSTFAIVPDSLLSQFDGIGTVPTDTPGDPDNRQTTRWEAMIPWASLNASGPEDVSHLFIGGVTGSSSVSTNDRYLSRTALGSAAWGRRDVYRQYAFNTVTLRPQRVNLLHADLLGDGLSNLWRIEYFGTPDGPGADEDSDGDGLDNRAEELAGTDPTDPQSTFEVGMALTDGDLPILTWSQAPGRIYDVWHTPSMSDPFEPLVQGLATNQYGLDWPGFFQLRVRR